MANETHLPRILFLCTGNSCRSQMAEGWARHLKRDHLEAHSAGTDPHGLNPLAVRVMAEAGVDISRHTSKRPESIGLPFDECPYLITDASVVGEGLFLVPGILRQARRIVETHVHHAGAGEYRA